MIGGYAQLAYGFNYYGTVGSNRDEFVIVRKMPRSTGSTALPRDSDQQGGERNESSRANRHGAEPRQVHRLSHLFGDLQERLDHIAKALNTPGSTTSRPSPASAIRRTGRTRSAGTAAGARKKNGKIEPRMGGQVAHPGEDLRQPRPARDRRLLRAVHLRLRAPAEGAGDRGISRPRGRAR
jgi:hypothetical protein